MQRKPSFAVLYLLVLAIAAAIVAAYALGMRGLAERRLIDAGLALVALLAFAWPSVARREMLLRGSERAGAYRIVRVREPERVAWPVEEWSGVSETAQALEHE